MASAAPVAAPSAAEPQVSRSAAPAPEPVQASTPAAPAPAEPLDDIGDKIAQLMGETVTPVLEQDSYEASPRACHLRKRRSAAMTDRRPATPEMHPDVPAEWTSVSRSAGSPSSMATTTVLETGRNRLILPGCSLPWLFWRRGGWSISSMQELVPRIAGTVDRPGEWHTSVPRSWIATARSSRRTCPRWRSMPIRGAARSRRGGGSSGGNHARCGR